ncbi:MAG TPA: isocitrate lyase/PEP mutase family protein, partial [Burkholderiales bacterium]|nr:isocitrate lyase/PEP mutase family protein [Burkholderiales bacterium]
MIPMEPRERASTRFRRLMEQRPLIVLGAYNPMTAKIVQQAGLSAVYMTGYGTSLSLLGLPDAGFATASEVLFNARNMANAVDIPVIADADNGYGNAINVIRTVRDYIQTGVAGI